MASFTGVGDNAELQMADKGDEVLISLSGTYSMTILFQREVGAPGSGAWQTLRTYSGVDATVSEVHVTEHWNEKVRLIVSVDTSGTATAALADNLDKVHENLTIRDRVGRKMVEFLESGLKIYDKSANVLLDISNGMASFSGGLRTGAPIAITTALTLTAAVHAGRTIVFNDADGATVTLPAASGTGARYRFFVNALVTSVSDKIQVANASDIIQGVILGAADAGDTVVGWESAAGSDTITLNGSTTGGLKGDWLELEDVATNVWSVRGNIAQTGAEATPFSAAV